MTEQITPEWRVQVVVEAHAGNMSGASALVDKAEKNQWI